MRMADTHEFFATCPKGFERLLAGELASLGATGVRALRGQVAFSGALADAYRVCLWSRIASRVVLVLSHGAAADADELYDAVSSIDWESHLSLSSTFAVDAHGVNDQLRNTQFVALRVKDAVCDRMQARFGGRPSVEVRHPDVTIIARVRGERVTLGIDLSGEPLFHRGFGRRSADDGLGGLRADYAAAMLAAGSWHRCLRHDAPTLAAAYAGSGTILVEAAGAALDRAPGLLRSRWGFDRWLGHDSAAWEALLDEADERAEKGGERAGSLRLISLDDRPGAASAARTALRSAGLDVSLDTLTSRDTLADVLAGADASSTLGVCDLSWLRTAELAREVSALGCVTTLADSLPAGSPLAAFVLGDSLDAALGMAPEDSVSTLLGRDEATIRLYAETDEARATSGDDNGTPAAPAPRATVTLKDGTTIPVLVAASDQFAARLQKVAKLRAKWSKREDVSCYRVYDADLPDYAVAIDLYQASEASRGRDKGGRWLVVQEYAAPKGIDLDLAHRRLLDVLAIAPHVLGVDPNDVTLRVRKRAKGGSQYASEQEEGTDTRPGRRSRLALAPGSHLVDEGGLIFEVNLAERLDTGLFLDHRDVRAQVRELAKGTKGSKRFLNLFAYTGTATCYAADGGAKHTTTVDLSRTYLDWAERNMERNGFTGDEHEYVQADVVRWISEQRRTRNRWDLVFCDPPTFSNSKRMGRDSFDVQRDHAELLIGVSRLLTADGVCLFSCNLRGFAPDTEKLEKYGVEIEDVTEGTIPEDFSRNAKIHHVYLVKRTPRPEGASDLPEEAHREQASFRREQNGPRRDSSDRRYPQGDRRSSGDNRRMHDDRRGPDDRQRTRGNRYSRDDRNPRGDRFQRGDRYSRDSRNPHGDRYSRDDRNPRGDRFTRDDRRGADGPHRYSDGPRRSSSPSDRRGPGRGRY